HCRFTANGKRSSLSGPAPGATFYPFRHFGAAKPSLDRRKERRPPKPTVAVRSRRHLVRMLTQLLLRPRAVRPFAALRVAALPRRPVAPLPPARRRREVED